jgi:molybdopterin-guanine dinucleotide biosynthesis protein A
VLAGGRGSRLGGAKAIADLAGRPLIAYPLDALTAAGLGPFIVAKPNTPLRGRPNVRRPKRGRPNVRNPDGRSTAGEWPDEGSTALGTDELFGEVEVVAEAEEPTHPLAGIVAALRHADGPLVVVACDFPFAPPALLRALADAEEPLVVPAPGGKSQPLMARWTPELLPRLEEALEREEPMRRTVAAQSPRLLDDAELAQFGDPARAFFNVNAPEDLRAAVEML